MTYLWTVCLFLGIAAAIGWIAFKSIRHSQHTRYFWPAIAAATAIMLLLTTVFDTLMIWFGLFDYGDEHILGLRVLLVPIEDYAYPIALLLFLPMIWTWMTGQHEVSTAKLLREAFWSSRPVSWINTAFPFAAAVLLTTGQVDWLLIVGTLYFLVPYNLAMYGINDVFDYESDLANPRKDSIEGALLAPALHKPMLALVAATNIPFLAILFIVGNWVSAIALLVSIFAVYAYSAPGLRFKERPVLDSITSSTHFVSPAVFGLTLTGAEFTPQLLLLLGAFFAWGMAAHAFGAVQDIAPDREAGIGSIATAFGARTTVLISLLLWVASAVMMLWTGWPAALAAVIAVPYLVICAPYLRVTDEDAWRTNTSWRKFIWINFGSGFVVTMIMIFYIRSAG